MALLRQDRIALAGKRVDVHVAGGAAGGCFAEVERQALLTDGGHHEAAATDVAGARINDGQRQLHSNGRIDSIAALHEDVAAHLRSKGMRTNDDTVRSGGVFLNGVVVGIDRCLNADALRVTMDACE